MNYGTIVFKKMKNILLMFLLLSLQLLGSSLEQNYKNTNEQIDEISASLQLQQRVSLYYLNLLTHDFLLRGKDIASLKQKMLQEIQSLPKTAARTKLQVDYLAMTQSHQVKSRSSDKKETLPYFFIVFILLAILVGASGSYFTLKIIQTRRQIKEDNSFLIKAQALNASLKKELFELQTKHDALLAKYTNDIRKLEKQIALRQET